MGLLRFGCPAGLQTPVFFCRGGAPPDGATKTPGGVRGVSVVARGAVSSILEWQEPPIVRRRAPVVDSTASRQ